VSWRYFLALARTLATIRFRFTAILHQYQGSSLKFVRFPSHQSTKPSNPVDLIKPLNIDSSLGARKELAKQLGYTGDMNDSGSVNIWFHKQVMTKLAPIPRSKMDCFRRIAPRKDDADSCAPSSSLRALAKQR